MDTNISLDQLDAFYKKALASLEQSHFVVPGSLKSVEELQQRCRICGCLDDGTFVDLDKPLDFEFDSSIDNYRTLFQRTSLQFQFHTMPDLPSRLCAKCGYKVKIFYLLTRQFVLGQYAMRATITEWYHNKYNIEPPEQMEDQKRLQKQLAMSEVAAPPLPALISVTPTVSTTDHKRKEKPEKKLPTSVDHGEYKRSISMEGEHGRRNAPSSTQVSGLRNKLDVSKLARSTATLNIPGKDRVLAKKTSQVQQQEQQQKRTRAGQSERGLANRPSTIGSPCHQCFVTARTAKPGARENSLGAPNPNCKHTKPSATNVPPKSEVPSSKTQVQGQQMQELKKRWR